MKMKNALPLVICAAALSVFAASCSGSAADIPANEEIFFSDKNGISFSLQITPCTQGSGNGKIKLHTYGETAYLYSTDFGRSFQKVRNSEISLNGIRRGCYSFCIMESGNSEAVTDIYTVFANESSEEYSVYASASASPEKIRGDGKITVRIENYSDGKEYEASADGWKTYKGFSGNTVSFDSLEQNIYHICVREKDNPEAVSPVLSVPILHSEIKNSAYIDVEAILQTPELPTGCEVTSLAMLLNHVGFDIDKVELADGYLPKGEYRKSDFNKVFVGNPRSRRSYGCTAGVICETAEKYLSENDPDQKWRVENITGCTPETLYSAVESNIPAVVWASINMEETIEDYTSWTDEATGSTISWLGGEHCLLLTGYDKANNVVYFNDPLKGQTAYDMTVFEKRFDELNRNAVIIIENK